MIYNEIERRLLQKNGRSEEIRAVEINRRIRRRYTVSAELALLRQREEKPEEFDAYHTYAEACKAEVDAMLSETTKETEGAV
ncbi:MAG: hypothetical protein IJY42_03680 [Clostridia bacterium]|nr:hypothetical protein [Clostridia bacterium]